MGLKGHTARQATSWQSSDLEADQRAAQAQHVDPGAPLQRRQHIHLQAAVEVCHASALICLAAHDWAYRAMQGSSGTPQPSAGFMPSSAQGGPQQGVRWRTLRMRGTSAPGPAARYARSLRLRRT